MSISVFSAKSKEATKLKDNGLEIKVDEDKIVMENSIDPQKMVQFNCLYNKDEIKTLIGTDGFTPEEFMNLPISSGYKLWRFNDENSNTVSNEGYCTTYKKLFELLNNSTTNLNSLLNKLGTNITLLQNSSLQIIGSEEEEDVSTYKNLISALKINNENLSGIINNIYEIIASINSFSVDEFLKTTLQKDEQMTSIQLNTQTNNYESKQVSITKYQELISELEKLTICLTQILIVEPNNDLKYIKETKTADERQYNYSYSSESQHIDTFSELINKLNTSTENIEKWITKIEQINTSGFNPDSTISLNTLKYVDNTNAIKEMRPTTLNNLITKLSENNNNIHSLLNSKDDFNDYLNKLEEMELLVCLKKGDEFVFQKIKVHNEKSTNIPIDALVESVVEGQFVDKNNVVKLDLKNLADINELEKNNVAINLSLIESIHVVFNTYKSLFNVIKHFFLVINSSILNPGIHFAANLSKFLWNNLITPGFKYGIDEYGKIKKYIINWGNENEFLPTPPQEDDSEILKFLKDKTIKTEEIIINTWNGLTNFFKSCPPLFYVAYGSIIAEIIILSSDCVGNTELLEDDLPEGLEEIFTPNKYSIVDVLYKLIRKLNNHIKNHPSASDSNFTIKNGGPDFWIKNENIIVDKQLINNINYNIMKIKINDSSIEQKLKSINGDIFKIILRKDVIYDTYGRYIKEFFIKGNNGKISCPIISFDSTTKGCIIESSNEATTNEFYIAFDDRLTFIPYSLWNNGDLSIISMWNQDALVSNQPVIKCDIIEAENALKLHKSDVHYFYKPSIISEDDDYYKMIFEVPSDYVIPLNLTFSFKEYCFGNKWDLIWNGNQWDGNNIQGKSNSKVIEKCKMRSDKNHYGAVGCYVMMKRSEWNEKFVPEWDEPYENKGGLMMRFIHSCSKNGNIVDKILFKDGTLCENAYEEYGLTLGWSDNNQDKYDGYDLIKVGGTIYEYSKNKNKIKIEDIDLIYKDLIPPNCNIANRLSFRLGSTKIHEDKIGDGGCLDLVGVLDTIEKVVFRYEDSKIDTTKKDIELYLKKDMVDSVDEVNWDGITNPFKYIIQQQFYEITPNPNAATTLYTDFNITSSKIITADNITTMRSDLNMVSNNLDVVSYDLNEMNHRVNVLDSEMVQVKDITQHLEHDVKNLRIVSYTALAFGIAGTIGSAASIGMQLFPNGISLISNSISSFFRGMFSKIRVAGQPNWTRLQMLLGNIAVRSISTDLNPIIEWCNSEYKQLDDITFENEDENPNQYSLSVEATYEVCNQFRETLKPAFKLLATKINELASNEYISKNDLIRSDTIDIVSEKVNNEIHLKAEDVITDGKIVVRLLIQNVSEANDIDYVEHILTININDGVIEYQGDNDFPTCSMNDKTIIISNPNKLRISGIQIKENTAKRNMKFDVNDFAYTCDIDALHKKIDSIFEQSHSNNESIAKIMNTYPTVDETNEALEQLKETMIDKENLYTSDKIILDSEGFISFDTTLNDSNDETIMTSKSTSKLLKAINKKFVEAEGKYALKNEIPLVVQSDETECDATAAVPSLDYVVNTYQTIFESNLIDKKANLLEKQLTALKSETDTKLTQLDNYYDSLVEQLDSTYYDKVECDEKFALKSENNELKAKINSLEARLAALEGSSFATKAELSQYRKLNDLVVSNQKVLPITNKEVLLDNGDEQWRFTTSHIPFHEGTHLIGKYTEPDGVEHEINLIFQGEEDFSEEFQNCFLILKQFQYSEGIFIEWDKMTGAIYIFDDVNYSYYMGCEITSAILDEGITLATNYDLTNYYSKDDLTRFGLIETDSYETNKFELSMDDKTHIRFKYLGSGINGVWNLIQIFVFQDISGHKHFIKWDFVHRIISLDTSFYTTYEIPKTQTNLEEINITLETRGFITTQELVNKFERFAYQQMSYQFANKLVSI